MEDKVMDQEKLETANKLNDDIQQAKRVLQTLTEFTTTDMALIITSSAPRASKVISKRPKQILSVEIKVAERIFAVPHGHIVICQQARVV